MSTFEISLVIFGVMMLLLASGIWIAISLAIAAWVGLTFFTDSSASASLFVSMWNSTASWELASLPLFIWMGEILFRTRLSEEMFKGLAPWLTWLPGRLLHVNVLACGIFASVSGSSAATCATIAKVSLPELKQRGYTDKMILGSLAGAGTLGMIIPPSIVMIVYAVTADVSIIKVFVGGFVPGLLLITLFSGYLVIWGLLHPNDIPVETQKLRFMQKLHASRHLIPVVILVAMIIGVLVTGYATATEAAAFGAFGALILAMVSRSLTLKGFFESLMGAMRLSCMIMFIFAGAAFLTNAMAFTGIPRGLAEWVAHLGLSPYGLIFALTLLYLVLGCFLDGVSMILLTTSIVVPMVQAAGFDLVWFGVFIVILIEIAQITPPVGFNLFVLQAMSGRDTLYVARAAIPFFILLLIATATIVAVPELVTWLPGKIVVARH
jgi:tripartite ATP-independent transporter DctM subunit